MVINHLQVDVSENSGFSTQIVHFNGVFHYFHHPFWGTPIFGDTHIKCWFSMAMLVYQRVTTYFREFWWFPKLGCHFFELNPESQWVKLSRLEETLTLRDEKILELQSKVGKGWICFHPLVLLVGSGGNCKKSPLWGCLGIAMSSFDFRFRKDIILSRLIL